MKPQIAKPERRHRQLCKASCRILHNTGRLRPAGFAQQQLRHGQDIWAAQYRLNDETHAKLLDALAKENFSVTGPEVRAELLEFFGHPAPYATKQKPRDWAKVQAELEQLRNAAPPVDRPKSFFTTQSAERSRFARELQAVVLNLGETKKKESGTVAGALHRAWIDTKVGLGAGDKSILESLEKGEDEARDAYREAIGSPLPPDVAEIVSRHARSIQTAHDQIKTLRDRLAA